ncbi:MAG: hypothetical protein A2285_07755 [Elusimicrobia bacterium RIFOXYA12_FULL_57_11]|nr:MAG: hypothetical protein A2285_07755 [Elusimicrobia bacterium RIFOXYA12_FULL_57_11]
MEEKDIARNEECVEAELVHQGGGAPRPEGPRAPVSGPSAAPGLFTRLKMLIAAGLGVAALALLLAGGLLTSTVIGAILGIPLMLAGVALLALLFKLFSAELKNFVVSRKFP